MLAMALKSPQNVAFTSHHLLSHFRHIGLLPGPEHTTHALPENPPENPRGSSSPPPHPGICLEAVFSVRPPLTPLSSFPDSFSSWLSLPTDRYVCQCHEGKYFVYCLSFQIIVYCLSAWTRT